MIPDIRTLVLEAGEDELLEYVGELSAALAIVSARRAAPARAQAAEIPDDEMTAEDIARDLKMFKLDGITPKVKPVYKLAERGNDPLPSWKPSPNKFRVSRRAFMAWKKRQAAYRG